jgi:hypothetical protein
LFAEAQWVLQGGCKKQAIEKAPLVGAFFWNLLAVSQLSFGRLSGMPGRVRHSR